MSLTRAVGRNTLIQVGGKIFGTVIGLMTWAIIQRYLAPTGYGLYTTALAYIGFLSVLADLGLYLLLVRELNKPGVDAEYVAGNFLGLRWTSALIVLGLGSLLIWLLPYQMAVRQAVAIAALAYVAIAGTQLLISIFQSKLAMGRVTVAEIVARIVTLIGSWLTIKMGAGILALTGALVGGSIVNLIIVWWGARRYVRLRPRYNFSYWRVILIEAWPITISVVLNLIYFRADTLILAWFKPAYDVGLYGAAYKILEILNTFPLMFVGLLLPTLGAAFASGDHDRFHRVFQRGFELIMIAVVPIMVGGWILAKPLLIAIGSDAYAPAAPVLRLLLIAVMALFLNSLSGYVVTIIHQQRRMVWRYLIVAAVSLGLYLVLIPRFSIYGAAIGNIIAEVAMAILSYLMVLRTLRRSLSVRLIPRLLMAGTMMGLSAWLMRDWNFWIAGTIAALVYGAALLITRTISLTTIKEIFSHTPVIVPNPSHE